MEVLGDEEEDLPSSEAKLLWLLKAMEDFCREAEEEEEEKPRSPRETNRAEVAAPAAAAIPRSVPPVKTKVLLVKNLPWTVQLSQLTEAVEAFARRRGSRIDRKAGICPVWDHRMATAVLEDPIPLSHGEFLPSHGGLPLESGAPLPQTQEPSAVLLVRCILLKPGVDYPSRSGAAVAYEQAVRQGGPPSLAAACCVAAAISVQWQKLLIPQGSVRFTSSNSRRKYAQLLIGLRGTADGVAAKRASDGSTLSFGLLQYVLRVDYSRSRHLYPSSKATWCSSDQGAAAVSRTFFSLSSVPGTGREGEERERGRKKRRPS